MDPKDSGSFGELFERLLPSLSRWAHGRLPRRARRRLETGDLLQEAAVGALQSIPAELLEEPTAVRGYLQKSIRNRIIDEIRRSEKVEVASGGLADRAADNGPSPLDEAIESDDRARYRAALAALDEDQQLLVVGRVDLDLSYGELALATRRANAEAARSATRRAVVALAREIARRRKAGID